MNADPAISYSPVRLKRAHVCSEAWLSPESMKIYRKFGFKYIHYIRTGSPKWLKRYLHEIVSEIQALIPQKECSNLIVILDMSTEGPDNIMLKDSITLLSKYLSIHALQVIIISQRVKIENGAITADSDNELNSLSRVYGDTFAWEAQLQSESIKGITNLGEMVAKDSIKKQFICMNNAHRPHRLVVYAFLYSTGIIDNAYFSFSTKVPKKGGIIDSESSLKKALNSAYSIFPEYKKSLDHLISESPDLSRRIDDVGSIAHTKDLIWKIPFYAYSSSFINIVTETSFSKSIYNRFTEKSIKPLLVGRPFIVLGNPNTLLNLRDLGFMTFPEIINEGYDSIADPVGRLNAVFREISKLSNLSIKDNPEKLKLIMSRCQFNQHHIVSGNFRKHIQDRHLSTLSNALGRLRKISI